MSQRLIDAAKATFARVSWGRVGFVLGLFIVAVSLSVLYHVLQDIDVDEIVHALADTPPRNLVLAGCFVAAAYSTLTFYDLFALRTIGANHVPYRVAALASFCSYSIGHNIGATVFSGGAIRYRIYSAWGLSVVDVAKLCFITGLTFWLGNLTMLGIGMIHSPEAATAVDRLPDWANRAAGFVALAALVGYLAWASRRPRTLGRRYWSLTLPTGTSTTVQVMIGIVDLTCCSLAMYMLMPADPPAEFMIVAVVFVSATLLGFASHAPGSLGVFDAAMLVALPQFDKEELIAALLLFRLLYFIAPFGVALVFMGTREVLCALATSAARAKERRQGGEGCSAP